MSAAKKAAARQDEVEVLDCEQGSDEWFELRRGIPTASRFAAILAEGEGKMRTAYLYQLAGERITGEVAESFQNDTMRRGNAMEAEAREHYERKHFIATNPVGLVRRLVRRSLGDDFIVGASPDAQVSLHKGLEIKTMRPDLLIKVLLAGAGGFPAEHRAQLQGTMWITGWDAMDLVLYYRGMPDATFTVERDDAYIRRLRDAIDAFDYDLRKLVERLQSMRK